MRAALPFSRWKRRTMPDDLREALLRAGADGHAGMDPAAVTAPVQRVADAAGIGAARITSGGAPPCPENGRALPEPRVLEVDPRPLRDRAGALVTAANRDARDPCFLPEAA